MSSHHHKEETEHETSSDSLSDPVANNAPTEEREEGKGEGEYVGKWKGEGEKEGKKEREARTEGRLTTVETDKDGLTLNIPVLGPVRVLHGASPSRTFLEMWSAFMKSPHISFYFFSKKGRRFLPQKWSEKLLANVQRGPILLHAGPGATSGLQNWVGNIHYSPKYSIPPTTLEAAKQVLREAYELKLPIMVIGGAYCSSGLASTRGIVLDTKHFNDIQLNENDAGDVVSATVESGVPIIDLIEKLAHRKKVLPTSPIFAKMSMGGGLAVGIHGTGRDVHPMPDYLLDVTVVNVNKQGEVEETKYTREENPEEMRALNVNLGAMGFVYKMTVEVHDSFNLKAIDEHVDWPPTREELITLIQDLVLNNEFVELFWWPTTKKLWVKRWNRTTDPITPEFNVRLQALAQYYEAYAAYYLVSFLTAYPLWTPFMMEAMMNLSLPSGRSEIVAPANIIYNYLVAVPPKQYDLNQCLNIPKTSTGYDFSAVADSYIGIRKLVEEHAVQRRYPLNTTLHTRFIAHSDAYMSPVYGNDISAMTEVLSWSLTGEWLSFFKQAEQMWLGMGGRPHWGKCIFQLPNRNVWGEHGTGMQKFLQVKERLDPHNLFYNDFLYDVFKRKVPRMMTISIEKISVHKRLLPRVADALQSLFHVKGHKYKIKIVTASDSRETAPVRNTTSDVTTFSQTFKNVTFSNYIAFQLYIDNHFASVATWHAPMYSFHEGESYPYELVLQPNWSTIKQLGKIQFTLHPINAKDSHGRDTIETVAVIGCASGSASDIVSVSDGGDYSPPDEAQAPTNIAAEFVRLSARAGFQVYVNPELGPTGLSKDEASESGGVVIEAEVNFNAKSASIVVFACAPEEAQKFVRKCDPLMHKVVVDATRYFTTTSGADCVVDVNYGDHVSVATIEEVEGPDGNHVNIKAANPGLQQAVAAWLSSIQLNPRIVD